MDLGVSVLRIGGAAVFGCWREATARPRSGRRPAKRVETNRAIARNCARRGRPSADATAGDDVAVLPRPLALGLFFAVLKQVLALRDRAPWGGMQLGVRFSVSGAAEPNDSAELRAARSPFGGR